VRYAGIEIILEEEPKSFLSSKGSFLFGGGWEFLRGSLGGEAGRGLFLACHLVDQGNGFFELFEKGVLDLLGIDSCLEFKLLRETETNCTGQVQE